MISIKHKNKTQEIKLEALVIKRYLEVRSSSTILTAKFDLLGVVVYGKRDTAVDRLQSHSPMPCRIASLRQSIFNSGVTKDVQYPILMVPYHSDHSDRCWWYCLKYWNQSPFHRKNIIVKALIWRICLVFWANWCSYGGDYNASKIVSMWQIKIRWLITICLNAVSEG